VGHLGGVIRKPFNVADAIALTDKKAQTVAIENKFGGRSRTQ